MPTSIERRTRPASSQNRSKFEQRCGRETHFAVLAQSRCPQIRSGKIGLPYATEAEWEYACRAGTTTRYCNGNDPEGLALVGNVLDAAAKARFSRWKAAISRSDDHVFTAPVGSFRANSFGLYDMHGKLREWCQDWYDEDYYGESPFTECAENHRISRLSSPSASNVACLPYVRRRERIPPIRLTR